MGGYWINEGLPQYVAIDLNNEDGCEIYNSSNGSIGAMLKLNLLKMEEEGGGT